MIEVADLVTEMVGEFPELQGLMGGYYAAKEGLPPEVAEAIRDHYKPVGQGDDVPTAPITVAVMTGKMASSTTIDSRNVESWVLRGWRSSSASDSTSSAPASMARRATSKSASLIQAVKGQLADQVDDWGIEVTRADARLVGRFDLLLTSEEGGDSVRVRGRFDVANPNA